MTHTPAAVTALDAMIPGLLPTRPAASVGLLARLRAAQARRQAIHDYRKLLAVEPHLLADIGLTRADVSAALQAAERG
jgi:uncharacterized protein YjiS (DUF1127 family)